MINNLESGSRRVVDCLEFIVAMLNFDYFVFRGDFVVLEFVIITLQLAISLMAITINSEQQAIVPAVAPVWQPVAAMQPPVTMVPPPAMAPPPTTARASTPQPSQPALN